MARVLKVGTVTAPLLPAEVLSVAVDNSQEENV